MVTLISMSLVLAGIFFGLTYTKETKKSSLVMTGIIFVMMYFITYFALPVLNWGYYDFLWEVLGVTAVAFIYGFIWAYNEDIEAPAKRSLVALGAVSLILITTGILSSPMCHSSRYAQRLGTVEKVEVDNFAEDVKPISLAKMRSVDQELARKVAEDKLGEDVGLGSRVRVGEMTVQNLTGEFTINGGQKLHFENDLVWVAPLEYRSFWKWSSNKYTPGYIIVDATDATKRWLVTEVNGEPLKMRYIESAYWGTDLERHVRFHGYQSVGLYEHSLEIDSLGIPHWVIAKYKKSIGFSAKEVTGVIIVDPQTGALEDYELNEVPSWIERVQPEEIVLDQISDWGKYRGGWWNSLFAEVDVQEPTGSYFEAVDGTLRKGMTLIYIDGQSYWYTGIGSSGSDHGTNGFMLVNSRTKEAKFYPIPGVNEVEATNIAQDQPFARAAEYEGCMPVLYNVEDVPTYFMIYKGSSGNVVGYCFLNVANREMVGTGSTKAEAEANYRRALSKKMKLDDNEEKKSYTVRGIVQENGVYYILFKEIKGVEFTASSDISPELKWTSVSDKVEVSYFESEGAGSIALTSFDKIGFEI